MGHAAGHLPSVSASETHSWGPSGLPISSWPVFCGLGQAGLIPDVLCRGAHHWCAEMKLCFLFVCGHITWHVGP